MPHDFSKFLSPFTWRYGSDEMRGLFSEQHKYELWRQIWVALAEAEHAAGLVSAEELADLKKHQDDIDIARALAIEEETKHDVVAAIREYAEKAKVGGGKIHLGATSMDVVDNAEALRLQEALKLIDAKIRTLIETFADKIEEYAELACLGYTHLQPAEPTTVGYRLAFYAQDLGIAYGGISSMAGGIWGKGMKGAVGTAASYATLLDGTDTSPEQLEETVMKRLGLRPMAVASQVVSRSQDYRVLSTLNLIAIPLAKFAGDLRILQAPAFGEWSEPFGKSQVGSSAMPFKKNPISAEKICSLARHLNQLPNVMAENAEHSNLERTLDDSANRRTVIPEAFLMLDEILTTAQKVLSGLVVNKERVAHNLAQFGPFAATEGVLMEAVKAGGDRQKLHEVLRDISLQAWQDVQQGKDNPMPQTLPTDARLTKLVPTERIKELMDVSRYVGIAPERAQQSAAYLRKMLA